MIMVFNIWQQGDRFGYHGTKFKGALGGKEGFIIAKVEGEDNVYSCHFPEMKSGDQDYILPAHVLGEYRPSKNEPKRDDKHEVKVEQRRPKGKRNAPQQQEED
jgi:hypothetical protein